MFSSQKSYKKKFVIDYLFFFNLEYGTPTLKCLCFPGTESRGKGLPLRSKVPGAWGLLQFHCFIHRCGLVLVQLFRHLFTPGEVLPYWPIWALKGHRDPRVSPLITNYTHNEDDFLCHLATKHLKSILWEQGSCSHWASGAVAQWLLSIRGKLGQHQRQKSLLKWKNVLLKNKSKHSVWWETSHTLVPGLS